MNYDDIIVIFGVPFQPLRLKLPSRHVWAGQERESKAPRPVVQVQGCTVWLTLRHLFTRHCLGLLLFGFTGSSVQDKLIRVYTTRYTVVIYHASITHGNSGMILSLNVGVRSVNTHHFNSATSSRCWENAGLDQTLWLGSNMLSCDPEEVPGKMFAAPRFGFELHCTVSDFHGYKNCVFTIWIEIQFNIA